MQEERHQANPAPCAPRGPERHPILQSNQTNDDRTLKVHVEDTEALLTAHDWLQNLGPLLGTN